MNRRILIRNTLAVCILILFVQTVTYLKWAPEAKGRLLLLQSLGGYEGGPPAFEYVVLDNGSLIQLSGREFNGLRSALEERGTKMVVHRDELPPANFREFGQDGKKYTAYVNASANDWAIGFRGPFFFLAKYGNYTGPKGAYGSSGLFVWLFTGWFKIWSGAPYMA